MTRLRSPQPLAVAISGNGWLLQSLPNGESIEEIAINGFDEVWAFPDRVGCTRSPTSQRHLGPDQAASLAVDDNDRHGPRALAV